VLGAIAVIAKSHFFQTDFLFFNLLLTLFTTHLPPIFVDITMGRKKKSNQQKQTQQNTAPTAASEAKQKEPVLDPDEERFQREIELALKYTVFSKMLYYRSNPFLMIYISNSVEFR
jgi:hypothetical protein